MAKKKPFLIVLVFMLLTVGGISGYYWYMNTNYVRTEDAKVDATIYRVSPMVAGKISEIYVEEGQMVKAGDVIARQDDTGMAQFTVINLAVIRSPISGKVIKKVANVGEVVAPGSPVVLVADVNNPYVTANIEETELARVKVGQTVDIYADSLPGVRFSGRVARIGDASLSTFSLLPANTGGNFTKVVQRVPVKIVFDDYNGQRLPIGTNVYVKIHVKD